MKKLLILLCVGASLLTARTTVHAYTPTADILTMTQQLKTQLNQITSGDMKAKRDFYSQIKSLQSQFGFDERLVYVLSQLGNELYAPIQTEKIKAKTSSKQFKKDFLTTYNTGIKDIQEFDSCTGWYNTLDTMSFVNNFPTALTIAMRYRETNCGYYLPNNGDGPFQIVSKDYGTGAINEDIFIQSVQDFIDFSKAKRTQYKTKLGIKLTYTGFDFTGIVYHSALYNGATITGNATSGYMALPNAPRYVYDAYGTDYSGAIRYGIIPKFLKILDWEITNTY